VDEETVGLFWFTEKRLIVVVVTIAIAKILSRLVVLAILVFGKLTTFVRHGRDESELLL